MAENSSDNLIGIKRLVQDIVETSEGRFITIVEISPINFDFKSAEEQNLIIDYFAGYTKVAPIKFRFKTISKRVDVNKYLTVLSRDFQKDTTKELKRYQNDYMSLIERLGSNEGVSRQFFIILELVETDTISIRNDYDAIEFLHRAKQTVASQLNSCGNVVIKHDNEADFVLETIYTIMNKEKHPDELWNRVNSIKSNVLDYYQNDDEALETLEGYYNNLCAPKEITFNKEYCMIDGIYYTFLILPSSAYPTNVYGAWLTGLINMGEGIDVDIFVEKKDTKQMRNKIRQKIRINEARANHTDRGGENFSELIRSLSSSEFLKNALGSGEDFFYVNTLITISGDSFEEIYQKNLNVKEALAAADIDSYEPIYLMQECLKSYCPVNRLDDTLYNKSKRNVTTSGLSSFYPFSSFEVSDDDGVLLGISQQNNSMVVSDNFNKRKYSNANICIFGTSGAGKTFTLQSMCMRFRLKGIQTFIITPEKGDEFERSCNALGGSYVNISSGSENRINIMEIRPTDDDNMLKLGLKSRSNQIILNQKIESLSTFFGLIISDMSLEEEQLLDDAIIKTYAQKGITKDNNSLIDHYETKIIDGKEKQVVVYKEMPILEDLYNVLKENKLTERLAIVLNKYVHGSASSFNGQTNVDLSNKFIVIDITQLSEALRPVGMYIALDYIWDKCKEDKTKKKVIAIDEAWLLISKDAQAASFVQKIFKTIRGIGGAAIAATQDINDFFSLDGGSYGKGVINNSEIKMLLKLKPQEADMMQEIFGLSSQEKESIKKFDTGQILVKSNSNTFSVNYIASPYEKFLISTDRETLNKIINDEVTLDNLENI